MLLQTLRILIFLPARIFIFALAIFFSLSGSAFTQNISLPDLPAAGARLGLSKDFSYPVFTGLRFNPDDPLNLTFLADRSGKDKIDNDEAARLIRYFLAGLTLPEDELWVNLSPYEQNRVAPESLAATDLGRDMLTQDYLLKQLTASLTYPESAGGKDYWASVYGELFKRLGAVKTAVNSYNKVWIVPGKITLWEKDNAVFISDSSLKVMTDFDRQALQHNSSRVTDPGAEITAKVVREKIIPLITRDINQGENFALLRQVYRSLILAVWFKQKFKESFYKAYIGAAKVKGIDLADKNIREKIFNLYVEAFRKGAYDYIKGEYDPYLKKHLRRRYYSGGIGLGGGSIKRSITLGGMPLAAEVEVLGPHPVEIHGNLRSIGVLPSGQDVLMAGDFTEAPTPIFDRLDPFESSAMLSDEAAKAEFKRYLDRREKLLADKKAPALTPQEQMFIAQAEMANDYRYREGNTSRPNRYELTPYMQFWLEHATIEQLADFLQYTSFLDYESKVWKKMGEAVDQERARDFGIYLWFCALQRYSTFAQDARAKVPLVSKRPETQGMEFAREWFTIKDKQFSSILPADVTVPGKYRVFAGGLGIVLLDDNGLSYKFALPASGGPCPLASTNGRAAMEYEFIENDAVGGVPYAAKIIGRIVAPNGSLGVICQGEGRLDSLRLSEHIGQLKQESKPAHISFLLDVFIKAMENLSQRHRLGVIHRDIKPDNIFVKAGPDGRAIVEVGDLGIATHVDSREGDMAGTPHYSAPEFKFTPIIAVGQIIAGLRVDMPTAQALLAALRQNGYFRGDVITDQFEALLVVDAMQGNYEIGGIDYKDELFTLLVSSRWKQYTAWRAVKDTPARDSYSMGMLMNNMLGGLLGERTPSYPTAVRYGSWGEDKNMQKARAILADIISGLLKKDPRQRMSDGVVITQLMEAKRLVDMAVPPGNLPPVGPVTPAGQTSDQDLTPVVPSEYELTVAVDNVDPLRQQRQGLGDYAAHNEPTQVDSTLTPGSRATKTGGVDFNYANFNLQAKSGTNTVSHRYAGAAYKGLMLKSVATQKIDPHTSLAFWSNVK